MDDYYEELDWTWEEEAVEEKTTENEEAETEKREEKETEKREEKEEEKNAELTEDQLREAALATMEPRPFNRSSNESTTVRSASPANTHFQSSTNSRPQDDSHPSSSTATTAQRNFPYGQNRALPSIRDKSFRSKNKFNSSSRYEDERRGRNRESDRHSVSMRHDEHYSTRGNSIDKADQEDFVLASGRHISFSRKRTSEYGNRSNERCKLPKEIKCDKENAPRFDQTAGRSSESLNRTFSGLPSHLSRAYSGQPQPTHGIHSQSVASRPIPLRDLPMPQPTQLVYNASIAPRPIPLRDLPHMIPFPNSLAPSPVSFLPVYYQVPQAHLQPGFVYLAPAYGVHPTRQFYNQ